MTTGIEVRDEPPNKGMKQTSVEHIGRSQLIPGVLRTCRRTSVARLVAMLAVAMFGAAAARSEAPPAPTLSHFKADNLTGAGYLRLSSTGRYDVIFREHVGVFAIDEGTWSSQGARWIFSSARTSGGKFSCRVVSHAGRTFLVMSGEAAPGIHVPEKETRGELTSDPKATPSYVFFAVSKEVFDTETQKRYPFKFYPEMNDQK
jgi:hypothetical protein